jgi:PAS domain S-box-containing protein
MVDDRPVAAAHVLYAEDNPLDADLTIAHFKAHAPAFQIDVVHTGTECLGRLRSRQYDVLLLDNHLPDMDGVDVLREVGALRHPVPVVVTTSVGDESLVVQVLQLGACDYVPKEGNYVVTLPAVLEAAIAGRRNREELQEAGGQPHRRILYVERHPSDIDLTLTHLSAVAPDVQVDVVSSASEALKLLSEVDFDLVLTDLRLPEMTALEMLREVRARALAVPFIVVTGGGDEAAAVAALKLGAYDYIVKRDDYLIRLPYAIEHAIARSQLAQVNRRLKRELAERQRLQQITTEALALLDTLQKHAPIGIAFLDRDYRFQRVNDELAAINGIPVAAHLGHTIAELLPGIGRQVEPLCRQALNGDPALNVEISGAASGGDERHFIVSFYPVRTDLEVVGVGVAMAEITHRRRAEAALREQATALADMARQKDEFLAMLSHELRNPLAPIRTALELLRRSGAIDRTSATAHDVIDRQVTHLARLLDDLLDVARITSGRINLKMESVDVRRIVGDAIDSTANLITARRHRLETSLPAHPVTIQGDVTRLVQVLVNLLNNAAKYTNEGGTIRVAVTSEDRSAVLRVADTGMGIPARLLPKIFDLFTQDDRTLDRAQGGLGLGLTLVRRITELHGGSVEVYSEGRGRGSEFTIRLPLHAAAETMSARAADVPSRPARSLRCLVVEDNVDAAQMLELALTIEGHEVRLAFDGRDAIAAADAFRPDVIVMDIGLPRMNGYDAARAIRGLPGLEAVHIIAVTGYGQRADHEKSRIAGVDTHLVKPVELDALLRTVAAGRARSSAG